MGAWDRFFAIDEMAFWELTFEVLDSFHLRHPYKGREASNMV